MMLMRPLDSMISGANAWVIHVHLEIEIFFVHLDQRAEHHHAGVVDQAIEAAAGSPDGCDGGIDLVLFGHVQAHRLHVLDGIEFLHILVFAGARVYEITPGGHHLGHGAAQPGTGAGDEHGFLPGFGFRLRG